MDTPVLRDTLYVNLFSGSGAGKSTCASGLFYMLKIAGVEVELVTEFAKELTWKKDFHTLKCQAYIAGKQIMRQYLSIGQVDVVITDSPLLLSSVYGEIYDGFGCTPSFDQWLLEVFNEFNNFNVWLHRPDHYNPNGRNQDRAQALKVDNYLRDLLSKAQIECKEVYVGKDDSAVEYLFGEIMAHLGRGEEIPARHPYHTAKRIQELENQVRIYKDLTKGGIYGH